jgi:hypothetical protein
MCRCVNIEKLCPGEMIPLLAEKAIDGGIPPAP